MYLPWKIPCITNGIGIDATKTASLLKKSRLLTKKESDEFEKKNLNIDSAILPISSIKRNEITISLKHNKVKRSANGTDN